MLSHTRGNIVVENNYKFADLFAGAGGFTVGFKQAGYKAIKAVEFDLSIAKTYEMNNPSTTMIVDDIKNVDKTNEFEFNDVDIIVGGPPCQGFSMAGARNRDGFMGDPRNYLFKHYFNIVKKVKPQAFILENVKGLLSMEKGAIFKEIKRIFSDKSLLDGDFYNLYWQVVKAVEFGVPQKRERVIVVGILNGDYKKEDFEDIWKDTRKELLKKYPTYFDPVTLRDAIGNMPEPTEDGIIEDPTPQTTYERYLYKKGKIYNHTKRHYSEKVLARLAHINPGENFTKLHENIKSIHSGSYGRMKWDEPTMTITTRFDTPSGGRFTLPDKDRTLTVREAARIQSFPDSYRFYGNKTSINKQVGNAVPPKLSYFLALYLKNLIA